MTLLDPEDVLENLLEDDEIPGAIRWAEHHDLEHEWDAPNLVFKLRLIGGNDDEQPGNGIETYLLLGAFEDYRVLPPSWRFVDPRDETDVGTAGYPLPGPFPNGSIFHTNGVICAPWNRLAYADRGGPHGEWQDAASWLTTATDRTHARTIPEMVARIRAEVNMSPRRMAPLPPLPADSEEAA